MKIQGLRWLLAITMVLASHALIAGTDIAPAANGIHVPVGYQNWRVIGVSHRTDNNSLRVIVGNQIAIQAARSGHTKPWPKGTVLGKLVWKDAQHPVWEKATVPGDLSHIEFMFKDPAKFKKTGGWGYARWKGMQAIPYGKDADFVNECYDCHKLVESNDYVFTKPVKLP